jgi:ComF family protein
LITKWIEPLITFIYPAACRECRILIGIGQVPYICDECWAKIEWLEPPWCQRCGIPVHTQDAITANSPIICSECLANPPSYGKLRATAFYEPTLREAIHLLKYERKRVLAKHLIQLMQHHLPNDSSGEDYDLLLPIPLHRVRYRKRGFNQSELFAMGVSNVWNVPVRKDVLLRVRNTVALSRLSSQAERVETITGAFDVRFPESIRGKRLLLVDDIFTTGTTIDEAVRVLQPANPFTIDVLVLCRTRVPESNQSSTADNI